MLYLQGCMKRKMDGISFFVQHDGGNSGSNGTSNRITRLYSR